MRAAKGTSGGRSWKEAEYCVDNASGALITYSPVPGLYTLFDYSQPIHFHDRLIPNKITISEGRRTVIEAQTLSVSEPPKDPSLFQPTGLSQIGVGSMMTVPWTVNGTVPATIRAGQSAQVVTVHGLKSVSGQVSDMEILASTDSALNQSALQTASRWSGRESLSGAEPGATPLTHEVFYTITFVGRATY
jgi:hypothetical protein